MSWYDIRFPEPQMTEEEMTFLRQHLNPETTEMLEYGSGYSTPNFASYVKRLTTVDHHEHWHEKIQRMCAKANINNVEHVLVPLNKERVKPKGWADPEAAWGFPTPWECVVDYATWPMKQSRYWNVVFIDGRARQWVGEFVRNNLYANSVLFVHDYPDRERYFTLENNYDKIEVVGSLAKFTL